MDLSKRFLTFPWFHTFFLRKNGHNDLHFQSNSKNWRKMNEMFYKKCSRRVCESITKGIRATWPTVEVSDFSVNTPFSLKKAIVSTLKIFNSTIKFEWNYSKGFRSSPNLIIRKNFLAILSETIFFTINYPLHRGLWISNYKTLGQKDLTLRSPTLTRKT